MQRRMKPRRLKQAALVTAGGLLALGAATFGGKVLAQTPGSGTSPTGTPNAGQQQRQAQQTQFLGDLASSLGISVNQLESGVKGAQKKEVSSLLQAGTITQAESATLNSQIDSASPPRLGPMGNGGPGLVNQQVSGLQAALDTAFQQTVGETRQQLMQELQGGKTPAQVFQSHNTTSQAVGQAESNAAKPLLDQAVQQQKITQQQETDFLSHLQNGPGFGPGGPGGFGGLGGPPPNPSSTSSATGH